jgi:hypothetical protein
MKQTILKTDLICKYVAKLFFLNNTVHLTMWTSSLAGMIVL